MIKQRIAEWLERRRRVWEELRFHSDRLIEDFIELGYDAPAARKLAAQTLGSMRKCRKYAYGELGATLFELLIGITEDVRGAIWSVPITLGVCSLFLQGLARSQPAMAVSWTIWALILLCWFPIEVFHWAKNRGYWRYHLYSLMTLAATALTGNAIWACLLIVWRVKVWPTAGWSVTVFSLEIVMFLLACCMLLRVWSRDRAGRCRSCASKLRLPDEHGCYGSFLLDATRCSTICIHGHGALTSDYWNKDWRTYGAFWDEVAKPSVL